MPKGSGGLRFNRRLLSLCSELIRVISVWGFVSASVSPLLGEIRGVAELPLSIPVSPITCPATPGALCASQAIGAAELGLRPQTVLALIDCLLQCSAA